MPDVHTNGTNNSRVFAVQHFRDKKKVNVDVLMSLSCIRSWASKRHYKILSPALAS
jgi:hypothetical protein